jgi:hypothetical protein
MWIHNEDSHYKVSACVALSALKLMITELVDTYLG